jgi:hypothetical protein
LEIQCKFYVNLSIQLSYNFEAYEVSLYEKFLFLFLSFIQLVGIFVI